MLDQANDLRELVLRSALTKPAGKPPKLVVVAGGKGGVGTTTVAVQLSLALARDGRRTVLVDGDLAGPDVAMVSGVAPLEGHIGEVLSGHRNVHEALCRGPAGVQIMLGDANSAAAISASDSALNRLLVQLRQLGPYAEYVVVDAGNGAQRAARAFWRAADLVLIVTTSEVVSVMDAYATIKVLAADDRGPPLVSVVNQAPDAATAQEVHYRMSRACRRFLGMTLSVGGSLPFDAALDRPAGQPGAGTSLSGETPLAAAIERMLPAVTSASAARPRAALKPTRSAA